MLAQPQLGVGPPAPVRYQGFVQDIRRSRGDLLGGDEASFRGEGGQFSQRFGGPGDSGVGRDEQITEGGLGNVAQVDRCRS